MDETTFRQAPFNQSDHLNAGNNPSSAGGACHMFSLAWLAEILSDKSHGSTARMNKMVQKAMEIRMGFKVFSDRWSREGGRGADAGVAKLQNVTVATLNEYTNFELVVDEIRKHNRTGFVYSFWFGSSAAHSIAVYESGSGKWYSGHIYVFEPNFGEYKMGKSQFAGWLKGFLYPFYIQMVGQIISHQTRQVVPYTAPVVKFGVKI